jgi:hypothetical protein
LEVGSTLWVRGGAKDDEQKKLAGRIPWEAQYELREGHWLFESERALPSQTMPSGTWRPLAEVLKPVTPTAALSGTLEGRVVFELQRTAVEHTATLLQLPLPVWYHYAISAPAVRLAPLQFMLNKAQDLALIRGVPLPPLSGRRYYEEGRIATPVGYEPCPKVSPAALAALLGLREDETALVDEAGTYAILKRDAWRPVDRSVVRNNAPKDWA